MGFCSGAAVFGYKDVSKSGILNKRAACCLLSKPGKIQPVKTKTE
jgi:hypothetical protein